MSTMPISASLMVSPPIWKLSSALRADAAHRAQALDARAVDVDADPPGRPQRHDRVVGAGVDEGIELVAVDTDREVRIRAAVAVVLERHRHGRFLPQQQRAVAAVARAEKAHLLGAQVDLEVGLQQERRTGDGVELEVVLADDRQLDAARALGRPDADLPNTRRVQARVAGHALDVAAGHEQPEVVAHRAVHRHVALERAGIDQHGGRLAVDDAFDRRHHARAEVADRHVGDVDVEAARRRIVGVRGGRRGRQGAGEEGGEVMRRHAGCAQAREERSHHLRRMNHDGMILLRSFVNITS
jgi:hypothetical protein